MGRIWIGEIFIGQRLKMLEAWTMLMRQEMMKQGCVRELLDWLTDGV